MYSSGKSCSFIFFPLISVFFITPLYLFKTVSVLSGVSTTTLYNNPILRERISSLRAVKQVPARRSARSGVS